MSGKWLVSTASLQQDVCRSMGGFSTVIDYSLHSLPRDSDLLVLIGGNAWNSVEGALSEVIAHYLDKGVVVAAICAAVDFLARNGLLNHYRHTGNTQYLWAGYQKYQNQDHFIEEQVVTDRNLITANGTAAIEFSEHVLKALQVTSADKIEKEHKLFSLGYYHYREQYGDPFV